MDSLSTLGTAAAAANLARPTPEIASRTTQNDNKANETPAVATSETAATPPAKKGLGSSVDLFA